MALVTLVNLLMLMKMTLILVLMVVLSEAAPPPPPCQLALDMMIAMTPMRTYRCMAMGMTLAI